MRAGFGERVQRAVRSIPSKYRPQTAVILGSGLSGVVDGLGFEEIPYGSIEEFPKPTVHGHKGVMCLSERAAVMAGRFHYYEGHPMDDVVLPIFVLKELGVKTLILTNAAGAVNTDYAPGDLVVIRDHLNLMGTNAFIGPNPAKTDGTAYGDRFFDMSEVYSTELRATVRKIAGKDLKEGVYAALTGPSYETPAEIKYLRAIGADLIGMSTVPEATAARYLGMKVVGISCVTNMAAGILQQSLAHDEVVEVGKRVEAELKRIVLELLATL
jgi:purine-nucleoside phosphorylase